ncbi:hypothetical protein M0R45_017783 [Rubus argutus]|uniref:Mediator complex subunit 15 KIX domain-containing protein n=1 Tax=Rubus argutus TaxID=59490 RepID=A0AAW1Y008_RUBAR
MVLQNDIDLLHPPADLEKRKHKLNCSNGSCAQSRPQLFRHGCEVPGLLQHYNCVQSLPNGCDLMDMDAADWRTGLMPDSRARIVNKIAISLKAITLKRHLPFSGQEGELELARIAARFEEKMYTAASSQSDYLRKISLKMLTMETKGRATTTPSNLKRHRVLA